MVVLAIVLVAPFAMVDTTATVPISAECALLHTVITIVVSAPFASYHTIGAIVFSAILTAAGAISTESMLTFITFAEIIVSFFYYLITLKTK
jgi:hypothetical protein